MDEHAQGPAEPHEPAYRVVRRPRPAAPSPRRAPATITITVVATLIAALAGVAWAGGRAEDPRFEAAPPSTISAVESAADSTGATTTPAVAPTTTTTPAEDTALPANSGTGRRVVFSGDRQRIWWVDGNGSVLRTALASGRQGVPAPGTFAVYSKSRYATGLDGSKMEYFVRFTKGPRGWAVGFHNIPKVNGVPAQTVDQLGDKLSHGCIRQAEEDAIYMWEFLDIGDTVVVTD